MKKRFLLTAAVSVMTLAASAQLQGDGYYRVYNLGLQTLKNKKCYTWVAADKVLIVNQAGTGQRFDAIELWSKTVKSPISEPASVIYATLNGSNIDLEAQGTSGAERYGKQLHPLHGAGRMHSVPVGIHQHERQALHSNHNNQQ